MGWRDHLSVHPAADLFPLMSETELRELGENIRADGLVSPIVLHQGKLLDGRNRLDAMELVGIKMDWAGDYINKLDGFVVELTGDAILMDMSFPPIFTDGTSRPNRSAN